MFTTNDFIPTAYSHNIESGEFLDCTQYCFGKILGKRTIKFRQIHQSVLPNCKTITKLTFAKRKYRYFSFDLLLKETKKISNENQKFLSESKSTCLPKRLSFYNRHTKYVPTVRNCFIRNMASDEFHEFRKVLNPEMNAYFTKASSPVWVREVLAEV
jgi:diphosphomevalonate decarboxylase